MKKFSFPAVIPTLKFFISKTRSLKNVGDKIHPCLKTPQCIGNIETGIWLQYDFNNYNYDMVSVLVQVINTNLRKEVTGGPFSFLLYTYYMYEMFKGVVNCQNSRDKGPPEGNSARG